MAELDIYGKRFAITGVLPVLRSDATVILENMGGIYKSSVTRDTDYLIVGDLRKISRKLERAQCLQKAGYKLLVLDWKTLFPELL